MQYVLFMKVRHTLRDLVYHLQPVDSCGISAAQALQVLDEVTLWVILADLLKRNQRQTILSNQERVILSHQEPWGLATRAGRAEKFENVRMVE